MKATRQACRAAERPILRGLTIEAPTFRHPRTGKSLPCVLLPNALSSAIAREAIASLAASTATLQAAVESAHDVAATRRLALRWYCRQHLAGERCRKLWWQDHGRKPLADARVTPHGCGAFDAAINAASDLTAL